ncbi:MAG: hypothetical protein CMM07_03765 [Rhodopirellula sp.]|nr:hypothetical protein [Rhodopirellula sp.]
MRESHRNGVPPEGNPHHNLAGTYQISFRSRKTMAGIERVREIRRLRTRRKKTAKLIARAKAGTMDKAEAARKLRRLTPGADIIIAREGLA